MPITPNNPFLTFNELSENKCYLVTKHQENTDYLIKIIKKVNTEVTYQIRKYATSIIRKHFLREHTENEASFNANFFVFKEYGDPKCDDFATRLAKQKISVANKKLKASKLQSKLAEKKKKGAKMNQYALTIEGTTETIEASTKAFVDQAKQKTGAELRGILQAQSNHLQTIFKQAQEKQVSKQKSNMKKKELEILKEQMTAAQLELTMEKLKTEKDNVQFKAAALAAYNMALKQKEPEVLDGMVQKADAETARRLKEVLYDKAKIEHDAAKKEHKTQVTNLETAKTLFYSALLENAVAEQNEETAKTAIITMIHQGRTDGILNQDIINKIIAEAEQKGTEITEKLAEKEISNEKKKNLTKLSNFVENVKSSVESVKSKMSKSANPANPTYGDLGNGNDNGYLTIGNDNDNDNDEGTSGQDNGERTSVQGNGEGTSGQGNDPWGKDGPWNNFDEFEAEKVNPYEEFEGFDFEENTPPENSGGGYRKTKRNRIRSFKRKNRKGKNRKSKRINRKKRFSRRRHNYL